MTCWKRLMWGGCAFLALALYVLPMVFQQKAETYQISKQWTIGIGILLIFLALLVFIVVAKKIGILSQSGKVFQKGDGKRISLSILGMFLISILGTALLRWVNGDLAPVLEEIIFRGILPLKIFKGYEGWGYIVGGLLFALFHGPTNIVSFVIYAVSSVILTLLAYRTRRLEVSIAVHMINNGLPAIIMLLIGIFGMEV